MDAAEMRRLKALNVRVYSTDWCSPCKHAKAFLEKHGVPFNAYDVEKEPEKLKEMMSLTGGAPGVPVICIGDQVFRGWYGEKKMREVLGINND